MGHPCLAITNLKARSLDVDRKEVTWEISDTQEDVHDFSFRVFRSESPEGPWLPVSEPFEDRYIFVDSRVPVGDKYRQLWYQLRCTHKASSSVETFGPAVHEPDPDLVAQYIRRHELTVLTQVTGRQVWLFKKRTFGQRCSSCFDAETHKTIRSNCPDCFNTGFLRGYMDPIEMWMQIDPESEKQEGQTTGRTSFYPVVRPGDLIVEAENKRWKVVGVLISERLRAPVKQDMSLDPISDSDIEYRLPVNISEALRDIQPSPGRMFTLPHDLNSALDERTPNVFANYLTDPTDPR